MLLKLGVSNRDLIKMRSTGEAAGRGGMVEYIIISTTNYCEANLCMAGEGAGKTHVCVRGREITWVGGR